jgi:hypothetical protein
MWPWKIQSSTGIPNKNGTSQIVCFSPTMSFTMSLVVTVLIAWLSVGGQALRAAAVKPGQVLHLE